MPLKSSPKPATLQEIMASLPDFHTADPEELRKLVEANLLYLSIEKGSVPATMFLLCNLWPDKYRPLALISKGQPKPAPAPAYQPSAAKPPAPGPTPPPVKPPQPPAIFPFPPQAAPASAQGSGMGKLVKDLVRDAGQVRMG